MTITMYWEGCGRTVVTSLRALSHYFDYRNWGKPWRAEIGWLVGRKFIHPGLSTRDEKLGKINKKSLSLVIASADTFITCHQMNHYLLWQTDTFCQSPKIDWHWWRMCWPRSCLLCSCTAWKCSRSQLRRGKQPSSARGQAVEARW